MDETELKPIIPFDQLDKFTFVKVITVESNLDTKGIQGFDISYWLLKLRANIQSINSSITEKTSTHRIYTSITILYTINPDLMDEEAWLLFLQENPTFLRGKCKISQNMYEREKNDCIKTLKEFYPELKNTLEKYKKEEILKEQASFVKKCKEFIWDACKTNPQLSQVGNLFDWHNLNFTAEDEVIELCKGIEDLEATLKDIGERYPLEREEGKMAFCFFDKLYQIGVISKDQFVNLLVIIHPLADTAKKMGLPPEEIIDMCC